MIGKDPAKYGFGDIDYLPPIEFDHVTVTQPVNLRQMAEKMNLNYEDFKALNPKFKGEVAPVKGSDLVLRIPPGTNEAAVVAAASSVVERVEYVADSGDNQVYRIRRGDNLGSIARRYRTSIAYIRDLNDLPRGKKLRVGMKIYVPDRTPLRDRSDRTSVAKQTKSVPVSAVVAAGTEGNDSSGRFYIVQSGDSLYTIAQKYSTSVSQLQRMNNIKRGRLIKIGMKIRVPGGSPDSSSAREVAKNKVHVVKRGENLSDIASKYNVSLSDIKSKNKIRNPSSILIGARIVIPPSDSAQ
ncbi:putative peptidoglycan endopeptidase LytE precursor [compost metagenome]